VFTVFEYQRLDVIIYHLFLTNSPMFPGQAPYFPLWGLREGSYVDRVNSLPHMLHRNTYFIPDEETECARTFLLLAALPGASECDVREAGVA
jgi:hypothetical protein